MESAGDPALPHIVSERCVFAEPSEAHFTVMAATVHFPDGSERVIHFAQTSDARTGAVCIITRESRILLARHWRTSTSEVGWELPRGMGNAGETAEQTALRETLEETGFAATDAQVLQYIHADTGAIRDRIAVVTAEANPADDPEKDDGELSGRTWLDVKEIDAMIARGEITDGITLAALCIWRSSRKA